MPQHEAWETAGVWRQHGISQLKALFSWYDKSPMEFEETETFSTNK